MNGEEQWRDGVNGREWQLRDGVNCQESDNCGRLGVNCQDVEGQLRSGVNCQEGQVNCGAEITQESQLRDGAK